MRKIINCNAPYIQPNQPNDKLSSEAEDIALITIQLAAKFLFTSGFHTKKQLRGPAQERYETLTHYLRYSRQVRQWFCQKVLFDHPSRFCEYILECPTAEVRTAFVRIIVFIAHFSLNDGPSPAPQFLIQHHQQQMQQNPAFNNAMLGLSPPSNNGSLSDIPKMDLFCGTRHAHPLQVKSCASGSCFAKKKNKRKYKRVKLLPREARF